MCEDGCRIVSTVEIVLYVIVALLFVLVVLGVVLFRRWRVPSQERSEGVEQQNVEVVPIHREGLFKDFLTNWRQYAI